MRSAEGPNGPSYAATAADLSVVWYVRRAAVAQELLVDFPQSKRQEPQTEKDAAETLPDHDTIVSSGVHCPRASVESAANVWANSLGLQYQIRRSSGDPGRTPRIPSRCDCLIVRTLLCPPCRNEGTLGKKTTSRGKRTSPERGSICAHVVTVSVRCTAIRILPAGPHAGYHKVQEQE